MKVKSILLTGDDRYNSIGTRLLVHFLKDKYELKIAGTKTQQIQPFMLDEKALREALLEEWQG